MTKWSMRSTVLVTIASGIAIAGLTAYAQQERTPPRQAPVSEREEEIEDRVAAIERTLASLDTRFELRDAARVPSVGRSLDLRVDDLERQLGQVRLDLQRVERQVESALREATDARRIATQAENMARAAQFR